jgi:hypothetical protein
VTDLLGGVLGTFGQSVDLGGHDREPSDPLLDRG